MDLIQFYKDYGIFYATEGHKHCREGWVNIECPFCVGNEGMHLGYNLEEDYFVCWRCGWKSTTDVISKLLKVSKDDAKAILRRYERHIVLKDKTLVKSKTGALSYEKIGESCTEKHKRYLKKRKYDAEYVIKEFQLRGTGPFTLLDGLNYSHRIIVPIFWNGHEVSFVSRDITGKHSLRYITCPTKREIIEHKHILYGHPETFKRDSCIVVEGVFDVFRFGIGAVATFGIKYTQEQVKLLSTHFNKVFVVYDDDPQAVISARKLASELRFRGVSSKVIEIEGDPGDMKQVQANAIKTQYLNIGGDLYGG